MQPLDEKVPASFEGDFDRYGLQAMVVDPVRKHFAVVLLTPAILVLVTLLYQILRTPEHTASVVVSPTDQSTASLSSQLSRLGGLAGIAGAGLTKGEVTEFDRFRFLLQSVRLGEKQTQDGKILKLVFREEYDPSTSTWVKLNTPVQKVKDVLWPTFGLPAWLPPDGRSLARHYERQLSTRELGDTGLLQVSYKDEDPERARIVLDAVIRDANELLRADASNRAASKAQYLREQLMVTPVAEYRVNLASLLGQQEQTLMLTSTGLPFAAETLQPLTISREPTSQRPLLFGMIAGVVGLVLGILVALLLGSRARAASRPSTPA